jgi:hypothetical protein
MHDVFVYVCTHVCKSRSQISTPSLDVPSEKSSLARKDEKTCDFHNNFGRCSATVMFTVTAATWVKGMLCVAGVHSWSDNQNLSGYKHGAAACDRT